MERNSKSAGYTEVTKFWLELMNVIMGKLGSLKKSKKTVEKQISQKGKSIESDLNGFFREAGQLIYEAVDMWKEEEYSEKEFEVNFTWICYILDQVFDKLFRKNPKAINEFMRGFLRGVELNLPQGLGGVMANESKDTASIGCFWYLISVFGENLKGKAGRRWIRNQFFSHYQENPKEVADWLYSIFVFGISYIRDKKAGSYYFRVTDSEKELPLSLYETINTYVTSGEIKIFILLTEEIAKGFLKRDREDREARVYYKKLMNSLEEVNVLIDAEWKLIKEKRRRALRSNGLDRIIFDQAAQIILCVAEVRLITEGCEGPDIDVEIRRTFYGVESTCRGFLDKDGKFHLESPYAFSLIALVNLAIVRAYRNLVVGGDSELDKETKQIQRSAESGSGETEFSFQTVVQGYTRKLADGFQNSEETYVNAARAGYSRKYLDGQNPEGERKNWVDEYRTPADASHLPIRVPRQAFSTKKLLKLVKEQKKA